MHYKFAVFWNLKKTQKTSILYGKIQPLGCVYDFFLGVHLLAFSVGNVVAYPIFSVVAVITEKFALQICCFLESSKNPKNVDFVRQNSALSMCLRFPLGVHHLAFSVGYVVAYPIFSVGAMITEKFVKQNRS